MRETVTRSERREARRGALRPGFTLVELLVAISIFVVVAAITIGTINISVTGDRIREAARQVQSVIEGGRDRAIRRNLPSGVRLLVDENDPTASQVTGFIYIGTPDADASVEQLVDLDGNGTAEFLQLVTFAQHTTTAINTDMMLDPRLRNAVFGTGVVAAGGGTNWGNLYERGLIGPGSKIKLGPDVAGEVVEYAIHPRSFPIRTEQQWASITGGWPASAPAPDDPNGNMRNTDEVIFLVIPHQQSVPPLNLGASHQWEFELTLKPTVLEDAEPVRMPRNTCIDLQNSSVPAEWIVGVNASGSPRFSGEMDLLFSPQGGLIGPSGAKGIIHLHIADIGDAAVDSLPGSPTTPAGAERIGDELGVTIFSRAGRVIVHPMDLGGYPTTLWSPDPAVGEIVAPTIYNGLFFECVRGGMSAGGEPDWNLAPGGLTQDGSAVWQGIKHDVWTLGLEGEVAR